MQRVPHQWNSVQGGGDVLNTCNVMERGTNVMQNIASAGHLLMTNINSVAQVRPLRMTMYITQMPLSDRADTIS